MRKLTLATGVVIALLAAAPAMGAPAQSSQNSPSLEGYSTPGSAIQSEIEDQQEAAPERTTSKPFVPVETVQNVSKPKQPSASGKLPFTGLDVALLGGAGCALLMLGFGLRRLTRAPSLG